MKIARKPLVALVALGAALAMPMAFAQSEPTEATDAATQATTDPAQAAPAAPEQSKQLTWADVDADGNGSISKTESSQLASLAQVFDQADADADGELTPDEYKAFGAKANDAQPQAGSEG